MLVTADGLGAWVIKCNPVVTDFGAIVESGRSIRTWCVANNYRSALMAAGQPAVLWVSGSGTKFPRGIWGIGQVVAPAVPQLMAATKEPATRQRPATLTAHIDISLRSTPIAVATITSMPALRSIEVLRQPFMSNPSWLSRDEFAALDELR